MLANLPEVQPETAAKTSRRNRRGRGMRGILLPPWVPGHLSRSEMFDDFVLAAMQRLEILIPDQIKGVEFTVENVPVITVATGEVPLGRLIPAEAGSPARVVVYRRPLEARAISRDDLHDLVFDVVIEQVAHLLGRRPEEVDPEYGGRL